MTFHYDFILKTFQAGNLRWADILKDSYWFRRHASVISGCRRELEAERERLGAISLTEAEHAAMAEYERIGANIKATANAARRAEQKALEAWKQKRIGPRWYAVIQEVWPRFKKSVAEVAYLEKQLAALEEPQRDIMPTLDSLERMGFMEGGVLTPLGSMATEVNEGHAILMPLFYVDGPRFQSPEELVAFLAVFLGESSKEPAGQLRIPETIRSALKKLEEIADSCKAVEKAAGVVTGNNWEYWDLNYKFVEIVWRYTQGEEIAALCADYELFGGNLIRILLKMGNIIQEWQVLATMNKDVEQLAMLAGAESLLSVGKMGTESLYLCL
jgi:superfamily II RNA helicase